jgi:hypothetical protein
MSMHKKIVKKLVENKHYFKEQSGITYSRSIGINDYGFMCDDNLIYDRQNIWYFSNDFEKILIDYKNDKKPIKIDEFTSENQNSNTKINQKIDFNDIQKLFYKNKDELKDLSWIIVDYY